MSEKESAQLIFEVMHCAFGVHNEIGKFCDEKIHKREIANRFAGVELEVPILVSFDSFQKNYFIDMLVRRAAILELKKVERIVARHRSQLLHYIHCSELRRGKLANIGSDRIEHEFVNTTLTWAERTKFSVEDSSFKAFDTNDRLWKDWFTTAVRDWGTGLDLGLYGDALTHILGGDSRVTRNLEIVIGRSCLGNQIARFSGPDSIFKVTTLNGNLDSFEDHARRFLANTRLRALQWVNVSRQLLTFRTLLR